MFSMFRNTALAAVAAVVGMAAGNNPVRAAAVLTISDQNDVFTITHSSLALKVTATGTGTTPVTVTQGNGAGDSISIGAATQGSGGSVVIVGQVFSSYTLSQGTGVNDQMVLTPESEFGGVLHFSGTWALSAGTTATTGSFADVAFGPHGSVADLLTWTVTSTVAGEASISGTLCANLGTGSFPCPVPAGVVTVGDEPNSFGNQDLTASWITDRAAVPEPASIAVLGIGFFGLALVRRRRAA